MALDAARIMNHHESKSGLQWALMLGALGIVYGDIGTSPLYAIRECFLPGQGLTVNAANVLGVLSLIFWSLISLVSIKYLMFVMRANNQGEGGILSLLALALPDRQQTGGTAAWLLGLGIFGAGLLYGDGVITPSLTVLSAIEGLTVVTDTFDPYVAPISIVILIILFSVQKHGTGKVGNAFGPVMILWFLTLTALGIRGILMNPEVLWAIDPLHGIRFLLSSGWTGFVVLGSVFLAVTGCEALYADMGHFGASPIRRAWFGMVLPALFINYLGQGALVLADPTTVANPFYNLAPPVLRYALVLLATAAAIIASQALITGTYSITMQAVQLGFLPRIAVTHTSAEQRGQIYVAQANWALMVACIALVAGFGSSSRLAAAYGIAVTLTMITTTILFYFAARRVWHWPVWKAGFFTVVFLSIEMTFCGANMLKILHGGWVPLLLGGGVFAAMTTWRAGRRLLGQKLSQSSLPLDKFLDDLARYNPVQVVGTAVFMAGNPHGTPLALLHNLKHNKVLHERNVFLTIIIKEVAHVADADRLNVEKMREGFYRVTGTYGFMDRPEVPGLLEKCQARGLKFDMNKTTFFLSSESIIPGRQRGLAGWRKHLFAILSRNAQRATAYFGLPPNRVVELGMQVEL